MADDEHGPAAAGGESDEQGPDGETRHAPKAADGAEQGARGEKSENADARGKKEGGQNKNADERKPLGAGIPALLRPCLRAQRHVRNERRGGRR